MFFAVLHTFSGTMLKSCSWFWLESLSVNVLLSLRIDWRPLVVIIISIDCVHMIMGDEITVQVLQKYISSAEGLVTHTHLYHKPVGDWISVPSPNFVAMATSRLYNILHGCVESAIPENSLVGSSISGLSVIQAEL